MNKYKIIAVTTELRLTIRKVRGKPPLPMGHAPSPPTSPRRMELKEDGFLRPMSPVNLFTADPLQFTRKLGVGSYGTVGLYSGIIAVKTGVRRSDGRHSLTKEIRVVRRLFPDGAAAPENLFPVTVSSTDIIAGFFGDTGPALISKPAAVGSLDNIKHLLTGIDAQITETDPERKLAIKAFIFALITYQIVNGLSELKFKKDGTEIQGVHCDVKPANVLLHKQWHIGLTDFGLTHKVGAQGDYMLGTPLYMAPELLRTVHTRDTVSLTEKQDVWSVAATVYELLFGGMFYETNVWEQLYEPNPKLSDKEYEIIFKANLSAYLDKHTKKSQRTLCHLEKDTPMEFLHVLLAHMFQLKPEKRPRLVSIRGFLAKNLLRLISTYNITSTEINALFQTMFPDSLPIKNSAHVPPVAYSGLILTKDSS
jgi:serine/threonine protein kinase